MRFSMTAFSFSLMLGLSLASLQAATNFDNTRVVTQSDATHAQSVKGILSLDNRAKQVSFTIKDQQTMLIPYGGIESMRFENTIDRLRRPFTNRVGRSQFLTIEYKTAENTAQYAVFKLNNKSFREVLAALETQTNKRVQYREN